MRSRLRVFLIVSVVFLVAFDEMVIRVRLLFLVGLLVNVVIGFLPSAEG